MKLRKFFCTLWTVALLVSAFPAALAEEAPAFTDMADIQYPEAVTALARLDVIHGFSDGGFHPTDTITRAEAAKLMAVIMNGGKDPAPEECLTAPFSDTIGHWAEGYIGYCVAQGILSGRGNGAFDPNGQVTKFEFLKMAEVMLGYDAADNGLTGSFWYAAVDGLAMDRGLYTDLPHLTAPMGSAILDRVLTREEAAQILYNALGAAPYLGRSVLPAADGSIQYAQMYAVNPDGSSRSFQQDRFGFGPNAWTVEAIPYEQAGSSAPLPVPALPEGTPTTEAAVSSSDIFLDGTRRKLLLSEEGYYAPITCDGALYVPLFTASYWLGAEGVWVPEHKTAAIVSGKTAAVFDDLEALANTGFMWGGEQLDKDRAEGIRVQSLNPLTVMFNGQAQNLTHAPLLFRGYVFLSLTDVGRLLGKNILSYGGNYYLYDSPTPEELAQADASLANVRSHLKEARSLIQAPVPQSEMEYLSQVKAVQGQLKVVAGLSTPSLQALGSDWKELQFWVRWCLTKLVDGYLPPEESSGVAEAEGGKPARPLFLSLSPTLKEKWNGFATGLIPEQGYGSYFLNAESYCTQLEGLLSAIHGAEK